MTGRPTDREIDEMHSGIRFWYGKGLIDREVAAHVGCSQRTVERYRKANGLTPNGISARQEAKL